MKSLLKPDSNFREGYRQNKLLKIISICILILYCIRCDKTDENRGYDPCAFRMSTATALCLIQAPLNGSIISSDHLTLKWISSRSRNFSFDLLFGTDPENLKLISHQKSDTYELTGLNKSTTYYWQYSAKDTCNRGCSSGISSFTIIPDTSIPYIVTNDVPAHFHTSTFTGGNVLYGGTSELTERGIYWGSSPQPEKTGVKVASGTGLGEFFLMIDGLQQSTLYYTKAYARNNNGIAFGKEVTFRSGTDPVFGSVSDIDGNIYKTVQIGDQTWMTENLRTTRFNDGTPIAIVKDNTEWCGTALNLESAKRTWYNNDSATYNIKNGIIYNGFSVGFNKICPVGWRVPSDDDWKKMEIFLGMSVKQADAENTRGTNEGLQLKDLSEWSDGGNGFNTSSYSGLPGGMRAPLGTFTGTGSLGQWWSSTKHVQYDYLWTRTLTADSKAVTRTLDGMQGGCSIRCLKN
jgi:uncharacterized protein (TIGR02145 family)